MWNSPSRSQRQQKSITGHAVLLINTIDIAKTIEKQKVTGEKEMGHEGQLDNVLHDCCVYLACVFKGNGFHRDSIRVLCN